MRRDPVRRAGLGRKILFARMIVSIERLVPALLPVLSVIALFIVLALFDVWTRVPAPVHGAALVIFAALLVATLWKARSHIRFASREEGLARLEDDSDYRHQPLRSLEDDLPGEWRDLLGRRLWQRHRARLSAAASRVKLAPPRPVLSRLDPWAVRGAVLLVLVVALVEARGETGERLARAFVPQGQAASTARALSVDLWITPPAYTRQPPLTIVQASERETIRMPQGSEAVVQLHDLDTENEPPARVTMGGEEVALAELGTSAAESRFELERTGFLEVFDDDDESVAQWLIEIEPDRAPEIAFERTPRSTVRNALEVAYSAADDHGLGRISFAFRAPVEGADEPALKSEELVLVEPARAPQQLASTSFLDLTAHPRAGLQVEAWLEATDGKNQKARSQTVRFTLPERTFNHPLAKAVIAERKRLVSEPEKARAVSGRLDRLAESRAAGEAGVAVQLGLSTSASRLRQAPQDEPDTYASVVEMLWELALMIEDGGLSVAERSLRDIQEALQRALMEGADDAELEALMQELQQAMNEYLDELSRQAMQQMQPSPQAPPMQPVDPSRTVDRQQLQEMLDAARDMMESGARDAARQMLSDLQQMLENLQAGIPRQQATPGEQALSDLQRMIELQQNLQDRSYQMQQGQPNAGERNPQGQQGQQGRSQGQPQSQQPGQQAGQAAGEQEGLRRALGELMRRLGEAGMDIPRALGSAEMQMREARDALRQAQPGEAVEPQGSAVDLMQQGGQAMLQQMREQMAQQPGGDGSQNGSPDRRGRDPLGRATRNEGGFETDGTEVPDENDLGRARNVLEELYRRSRELERPALELDYYDRLLDRF